MNIKNTMCLLSDLTQEQIDSLRAAMPEGQYDFFAGEDVIGVTPTGEWGTWDIVKAHRTIVNYDEMMQLLGGRVIMNYGRRKSDVGNAIKIIAILLIIVVFMPEIIGVLEDLK